MINYNCLSLEVRGKHLSEFPFFNLENSGELSGLENVASFGT